MRINLAGCYATGIQRPTSVQVLPGLIIIKLMKYSLLLNFGTNFIYLFDLHLFSMQINRLIFRFISR